MNLFKCHRHSWLLISVLLTQLFTPLAAHAQSATWTNPVGGNWSDAGNWNTGVAPGSGTNVFLVNPYTGVYPIGYIATNDVVNNTIGNLTIYDLSGYRAILYSAQNGFNLAGDVSLGYAGTLMISNSTAMIGGSVTISNYGQLVALDGANVTVNGSVDNSFGVWVQGSNTVLSVLGGFINKATSEYPYFPYAPYDPMFFNKGTLNIGGTSAASANASAVTFTNAGMMTFNGFFNGYEYGTFTASAGTINASTNQVGIYNTGTIKSYIYGGATINATLVNETNGAVILGDYGDQWVIERFPTNRGSVYMEHNGSALTVNKGNFVNQGFVHMGYNSFSVLDGSFINDTNGLFTTDRNFGSLNAKSVLNRGTMSITNTTYSGFTMYSTLTNEGTISLYREPVPNRNYTPVLQASNIVNSGTIVALGPTNLFTHSDKDQEMDLMYSLDYTTNVINNLPGGVVTTTNGAILALGYYSYGTAPLVNHGKLIINSDSTLGIGGYSPVFSSTILYVGLNYFNNDGIIDLRGGAFGVSYLSNAVGATVQGHGDIGLVVYSNKTSASLLTTNYVQEILVSSIANAGTIAPNGILNAGGITNLSGGQIIGSGAITSGNVTNYFVGETLVTTNINTGARILNNAGASILASGGTLVLQNGLVNNSNAGIVGGTNGGTLQLGDGTMALTNNGTVRLSGGGLTVGNLRNNGSIHLLAGGPNTLTVAGALTIASGATMSATNSSSTVSGVVTNQGTIRVVNSTIAYTDKMFGAGRYISDPSTSTFFDDVTIAPSGTLEGGVGDVFDFKKNLFISSTNTSLFDLVSSTVSFSGGGDHTNSITGLDFDTDAFYGESHGYTATNFAYGTLMLGPTDNLYFIDGDGNPSNSNGLYISVLDVGGTTNDLSRLHTPFNIYYRNGLAGNEYLGGLSYSLDGGGLLIAIPEPSTAMLLLTVGAILLRRRSR